jgi:hypothetical protein
MPGVKLVVIYPRPKDIDAFEKVYQEEHVPMAVKNFPGKTKLVATKVLASPPWDAAVLPRRRNLLPFAGSFGSVHCNSWHQGDDRSRSAYLLWRYACHADCRRGDL